MLREMIQAGTLKPLPFLGENYRLHARTVLLQLGVTSEALGQSTKLVDPGPDIAQDGAKISRSNHPFTKGITPETSGVFTTPENQNPPSAKLPNHNRRRPPPKAMVKTSVIRRSYRNHGRLVAITQVLKDSARQQLAEANVLDLLVNSIRSRLAAGQR